MNQAQRILTHLKRVGSIDPLTAWSECGVYRLSSVIHILRHEYEEPITTEWKVVRNQFGEECRVANYVYKPNTMQANIFGEWVPVTDLI